MSDTKFPISEVFVSPQGEGVYAGQMQCFIRLAGCTVGRPYHKSYYESDSKVIGPGIRDVVVHNPTFPIYTEKCTLYDGREFPCDTDYRVKGRMSVGNILALVPDNVDDVCITGGEPLMHDLSELIGTLHDKNKKIHIETSGTIYRFLASRIWITVSPKFDVLHGMLHRADEIKLLVDDKFSPTEIRTVLDDKVQWYTDIVKLAKTKPIYLQPVNFENKINPRNLALCKKIQEEFPMFRISPQMHKVMSEILGELIR